MKPGEKSIPDVAGPDVRLAVAHDVEVDGAQVASAFGVSAALFLVEMRRGNVHGTIERGIDADVGRHRLTFRYRGRTLRFILHPDRQLATLDDGR